MSPSASTETAPQPAAPTLDSTYFISFEMSHNTLKRALKKASALNITQYRVLMKLFFAQPQAVSQTAIGEVLHLKPNVMAQAVTVLDDEGYLVRRADAADARVRACTITDAGVAHVEAVNAALVDELYRTWPTDNPAFRRILETVIMAGAHLDPDLTARRDDRLPASHVVTTIELISQRIEETMEGECHASFAECRIMQRLGEVGTPLRLGDVAGQLIMTKASVTRYANRLADRGWVQKLSDPTDYKAVYIAPTAQGAVAIEQVNAVAARAGATYFWSIMDEEQTRAFEQMGSIVIADLQRRKEAKRLAALDLLVPLP